MAQQLTTEHGDTIFFEVQGTGPTLVFITGAGSFRANDPTVPPTAALAARRGITTVVYDRLGLGESTGSPPVTLAKEISVLRAIVEQVGGSAVLCGHSSGSAIALHAAAAGLPVQGLALWEVPILGTAEHVQSWAATFIAFLEAADHLGAIEYFTKEMPADYRAELQASSIWNDMVENAQSLRADVEALAWFHSAPLSSLLGELRVPVLTMIGETTFDVMNRGADAIAQALPDAQKRVVPGAQHEWVVAPMVEELTNFVTEIGTHRNQGG